MAKFVLLRSTVVFSILLVEAEAVEAEAIGVEAEAVDEIAASTSLSLTHRAI